MKKFHAFGTGLLFILAGLSISEAEPRVPDLRHDRSRDAGLAVAAEAGGRFDALIATYAAANEVPIALAHAVVTVESNYDPKMRGSAGEIGLMQVKLPTARAMGYRGTARGLYDPATNLRYGMRYLGEARRLAAGDLCGTVLKYNGGHGATRMSRGPLAYCGKVRQLIAMN